MKKIRGILIFIITVFALILFAITVLAVDEFALQDNGAWVLGDLDELHPECDFLLTVREPSRVDVSVRAYTDCLVYLQTQEGKDMFAFSNNYYGSPSDPHTQTTTKFLNPGNYRVHFERYETSSGKVGARYKTTPIKTTEAEPNDTFSLAHTIALGELIHALLPSDDMDNYIIEIPHDGNYTLDFEANFNFAYLIIYDRNYLQLGNERLEIFGSPELSSSTTLPLSLRAGRYYLRVASWHPSEMGPYSFVVEASPKAEAVELPSEMTLPVGLAAPLKLETYPIWAASLKTTWNSSKSDVASVDQRGIVTANKPGTSIITVVTEDGLTARCDITVVENEFQRAKPLVGKNKGVYTSTKKMYYKDDYLYTEIYLYNKSGKTLREAKNLYLIVRDSESGREIYKRWLGTWTPPKGSIKNKSYSVINVRIPRGVFPQLDLASGRYDVLVYASYSAKSANVQITPMYNQ